MRHGQIDEALVIGILANAVAARSSIYLLRPLVAQRQYLRRRCAVKLHALRNVRVGQHALQLFSHAISRQPPRLCRLQRGTQRLGVWRLKQQYVEHDVGIEHHGQRLSMWHSRPA